MRVCVFRVAILSLVLGSSLSLANIWDTPTVWLKMANYNSKIEGTVKTVAHDTASDRYVIRIKSGDSTETLNICYEKVESARNQSDSGFTSNNPHLQMLIAAMDEGKKVRLTYGGIWNKCITSIQLEKTDDSQSIETAGEVEEGFQEI